MTSFTCFIREDERVALRSKQLARRPRTPNPPGHVRGVGAGNVGQAHGRDSACYRVPSASLVDDHQQRRLAAILARRRQVLLLPWAADTSNARGRVKPQPPGGANERAGSVEHELDQSGRGLSSVLSSVDNTLVAASALRESRGRES